MTEMDLENIYKKCLSEIGGENNKDVAWYLNDRPKKTSRKPFFKEAVRAMWVCGMSRKSRDTFLKKAEINGFTWNYADLSSWNSLKLNKFMKKLHGNSISETASKKWKAIHKLAKKMNEYTEREFRTALFNGKVKSSNLDKSDIHRIVEFHYPYIGKVNASYIIRNIGGEAIKYDRWIKAFTRYYKISFEELEKQLINLKIPLGEFDIVMWAYCEKFIKKEIKFEKHFEEKFS